VSGLIHLDEPTLKFAYGQDLAHPKDGLMLFGPYTQTAGNLRYGVIGTAAGIALFNRGFSAGVDRKLQLLLEGVQTAGPFNRVACLGIGSLPHSA
jgi:hypothetical protein